MEILHNPRCTKSRQTLQLLESNNAEFTIVEYLKNTPSKSELTEIIRKLGISAFELIRKGESIYKEQFKGKTLSEEEWIDVMIEQPKLIERPIFINGEKAVIGRPPENILSIL